MSSGRHAGFMAGEEEGAPAHGDPRHCEGCLRVFPEVCSPPASRFPGAGLTQTPAGGPESWRGKGSEGRPWWLTRSVGTSEMFQRLCFFLASGPPGTILESNCLLIPFGCN